MDGTKECDSGLVVASGQAAVLLEASKEVLDEMARLVDMAVIAALVRAGAQAGNDCGLARLNQWLDDPGLGIVGLVRNDHAGRDVLEENIGTVQIRGLTRRQKHTGGIAQGIDGDVDLRAQASSAASDGLLEAPPFAPALC